MTIDTLTLMRDLRDAGFPPPQAEATAAAIGKAIAEIAPGVADPGEKSFEYLIGLFSRLQAGDAARQAQAMRDIMAALKEQKEALKAATDAKAKETKDQMLTVGFGVLLVAIAIKIATERKC